MKRLLLTFSVSLFFATLLAQEVKPNQWVYRPYTRTPATLGDLIDYQKHCYNDSTIIGYEYTWNIQEGSYQSIKCYCVCSMHTANDTWKYFECGTCIYPEDFKIKMGFNYECYKPILYHEEPTFNGFIEYMEKKYKK